MGFMYWLRASLMTLAFIGTVLIIREFNQPPGSRRAHVFGALGGGDPAVVDVNLCPTRVARVETSDGRVIRQEGLTWVREHRGGAVALDQVAVEKWFAKYCRTEGRRVAPSADVKPALKVEFVSGPTQTLIRSAGGEYEWMHQPFASPVMDEALKALGAL